LFVDAAGRLLAFGDSRVVGGNQASVVAMAGVRMRSVVSRGHHLALGWDGCVYSWGDNQSGKLGHGDMLDRLAPSLVQGLKDVRSIGAAGRHSLAATRSGTVISWGCALWSAPDSLCPTIVEGFGSVRVHRVFAGGGLAFALGEAGEVFSWDLGAFGLLGHGGTQDQPSLKRVEALQGVRVSSVSIGRWHALALAADGLVYSWGGNVVVGWECGQSSPGQPACRKEAAAEAGRGAPGCARGERRRWR
jgi:alpha-tubulin suppressor-like RCC1 family protein